MERRLLVVGLMACALAACGAAGSSIPGVSSTQPGSGTSSSGGSTPAPGATGAAKIAHIVVIIQENRSFDNLFMGFPGADTVSSGKMSNGTVIPLAPVGFEFKGDINHSHVNFEREYAGGNLDFDQGVPGDPTVPYAYVPRSESQPYWDLASQYTLADRMFQSNSGPSYPAHLYLVGAQSQLQDENPNQDNTGAPRMNAWGCDDPAGTWVSVLGANGQDQPGPFPCFDEPTVADELDAADISWRYYAPAIGGNFGAVWSPFDAIRHIRYSSEWQSNVLSPEQRVLTDAASGLPSVTWVAPSIGDSDHSGTGVAYGPSWVSSVVNAIGNSPDWNSTAIFIVWDDWGGWYDHVSPPQLDPMGLGFRVPLIVVSPYAKHGYVSHVQYEFGSILRYIEDRYALQPLSASDRRANSLSDCFDYTQAPRAFRTISAAHRAAFFLHEKPSGALPDDD